MSLERLYTIAQFAGLILLALTFAVGAVTVYLGWRVNKAQKADIRQKEERLARDLRDKDIKIAAANTEAAKANERAQNIEQQNIKLQSDLTTMLIDVANARQKQAEAERALEVHRTRLRLQPRSLTAEQRAIVTRELQRDRALHALSITVVRLGDEESATYAQQIVDTIGKAGWRINVTLIGTMSPRVYGLICSVVDPSNPPMAAQAVLTAFGKAGIQIKLQSPISPPAETDTVLVVGLKPPAL